MFSIDLIAIKFDFKSVYALLARDALEGLISCLYLQSYSFCVQLDCNLVHYTF